MRCPRCGGDNIKRHGRWGKKIYICIFCGYTWRKEKKPEYQYYYERDAIENKVGLIEEMKDHL